MPTGSKPTCQRRFRWQKGDRIRITKNGFTEEGHHRLSNGSLHTVKGFTGDGDIKLTDGRIVPQDYAHLTHGYATTSMTSQGQTVDRVFIAEIAESFPAASRGTVLCFNLARRIAGDCFHR